MPTGAETCSGTADEDCDGTECALWARMWGGSEPQYSTGMAVAPNGDVYFTGALAFPGDSITFAGQTVTANNIDISFLAKMSAQGDELWIRMLPGGVGSTTYEIVGATSTRVVITADLQETLDFGGASVTSDGWNDVVFAAFDAGGDFQWAKPFLSPGESTMSVTAYGMSPLGQAIVAGFTLPGTTYDGEVVIDPLSGEERSWYGMAIDPETGALVWHRDWTVSETGAWETYKDIGFGPQGDIYITGSTSAEIAFGGPPLVPGGVYAEGYIAHLDPEGQWVDGAFFCNECLPKRLAIGPSGEVAISAWLDSPELSPLPNPSNLWSAIYHLDAQYQADWAFYMANTTNIQFTSTGELAFMLIDHDPVFLGSSLPLKAIGIWDLFTGRLAMDGTLLWHRQFGAPDASIGIYNDGRAFGLQPGDRSVVVADLFGAPVDFGCGPLEGGTEDVDISVIQLAP
jgi:hypothetical protein